MGNNPSPLLRGEGWGEGCFYQVHIMIVDLPPPPTPPPPKGVGGICRELDFSNLLQIK